MFLSKVVQKVIFMLIAMVFLGLLVYLVFQRGKDIKQEIVPTMETEFSLLENNKDYFINNIKKILKKNKNKIDSRNCKGFLYDSDNNGAYDDKIMDEEIGSLRKNIIVKYNFCAYNTSKNQHFLVIFSTTKLVNNFMKKEMGEEYIPTLVVNISNGNDIISEKALISSEILLEGL